MGTQKKIVSKYATIVVKYKEDESSDYVKANGARLLYSITNAILDLNSNGGKYGYSNFDLTGFYIDPDEMDIETQNEEYNKLVNKSTNKETTKKHNKEKRSCGYND